MRKSSFWAMFIAIVALASTSCNKTGTEVKQVAIETVSYTDDPPKELFGVNETYATARTAYLTDTSITNAEYKGERCNGYDPTTGQCQDRDFWYLVPARKFWGIYKAKIYISISKDWYGVRVSTLEQGKEKIKRTGSATAWICRQCQNPFGTDNYISGIQ